MNIKSLAWSTLLTIIFSTGITLLGELSKPFKDLLTSLSGHHWVTKSIAILIFFAIMYFLLRNLKEEKDLKKTIILVIVIGIGSGITLLIFFGIHAFK